MLRIKKKIGDNSKIGTIFKVRRDTGRNYQSVGYTDEDLITTRIMWLEGQEKENRAERYIYIHGTNEENFIGTPRSYGCIRMANTDVVELFDLLPKNGTYVYIVPSPQQERVAKIPETILLIGSDKVLGRERMGERGDSLELISSDTKNKVIRILAIPRDTYTQVNGKKTKINHALAYGGWKLQKTIVEQFLGVEVSKTFFLDMDGLRGIFYNLKNKIGVRDLLKEVYNKLGLWDTINLGWDRISNLVTNREFRDAAVGRAKNHAKMLAAIIQTLVEYYRNPDKRRIFERYQLNGLLKFARHSDLSEDDTISAIKEWSDNNYRIELYCVPGTGQWINNISYWVPREFSGYGDYFTKVINHPQSRIA